MDESTNINDITLECFINKTCKEKYLKNHNKTKLYMCCKPNHRILVLHQFNTK